MRKFFIYILVVCILISCLAFNVFASDVVMPTSFARSFVDLLEAKEYTFLVNDVPVGSSTSPSLKVENARSVTITFDVSKVPMYSGLVFCINSPVKPTSISVVYSGTTYNNLPYVNSLDANHYYRWFQSNSFPMEYISFIIKYSANYTGPVGINSCYGVVASTRPIDAVVNYSFQAYYNAGDFYEGFTVDSGGVKQLPINYLHGTPIETGYLYFQATVPFNSSVLDSASFIIETIGDLDPGDISFGLYGGDTLKYLLPVDIIQGTGYSYDLEVGNPTPSPVQKSVYIVNVELSGVDLGISTGRLMVKCNPLPISQFGTYYTGINLVSYCVRQEVPTVPWYVNFYHWISETILDSSDAIVGAISGSEEDLAESEQLEAEAESKKEEAAQLQQNLVVSKPDVVPPSSNDDIGGMLTGTGVAPIGSVLGVITGNSLVLKILLTVFTLALCAYVFFGKKG